MPTREKSGRQSQHTQQDETVTTIAHGGTCREGGGEGMLLAMVYLDNHATTAVAPEVLEAMLPYFREQAINPSSGYRAGKKIRQAIDTARGQVAELIGAKEEEVTFTGCGTESNNAALKSLARVYGRKTSRVITSEIEHSAVLRPIEAMEAVGFEVARVGVDVEGRLDLAQFDDVCQGRGFVSVMWANNETGVVQPVREVAELCRERGFAFHTDAIQAVGKVPVDVREAPIDFLSISGHKIHAPKGVGALFMREGVRFEPLLRGGGQEFGHRSGTENVPSIVGLGAAAALIREKNAGVGEKRDYLEQQLLQEIEGVQLNGSREHRVPTVAHVSFQDCEGAGLMILLDQYGVQVSTGSACMTGKQQPSHVQKAMGFSDQRAKSSLRLSLSGETTYAQLDEAIAALKKAVTKLRSVQGPTGMGPVVVYS